MTAPKTTNSPAIWQITRDGKGRYFISFIFDSHAREIELESRERALFYILLQTLQDRILRAENETPDFH